MKILSIDPGSSESAYAVLDRDLRPIRFGKISNEALIGMIYNHEFDDCNKCAIEMIASYGMGVGATVFDTCVMIGRLKESIYRMLDIWPHTIFRKEEKINICGTMKAKDSNIRLALINRFAQHDFKNGKGNKKKPDWFFGVSKDVWAAIAVGVTYKDLYLKEVE